MAYFSRRQNDNYLWDSRPSKRFPWLEPRRFTRLVILWIQRLTLRTPLIFLAFTVITFSILTFSAAYFYGSVALEEGLLYHFSRVDHRHNYSIFWYWIYLARARAADTLTYIEHSSKVAGGDLGMIGKLLIIPQAVLLGFSSVGLAPYDLPFALFVQTFLFVIHNKVITAQYFTWYLCLLPLCAEKINWKSTRMYIAFVFLGFAFIIWLLTAFCLEMLGKSVFFELWMCSVVFFVANTVLLCTILESYNNVTSLNISPLREKKER